MSSYSEKKFGVETDFTQKLLASSQFIKKAASNVELNMTFLNTKTEIVFSSNA